VNGVIMCRLLHARAILAVVALCFSITFNLGTALADYSTAKRYFETLKFEDQLVAVVGLISTGDFDGLLAYGFTKRLYRAVLSFQTKERLPATGILGPGERQRLDKHAQAFWAVFGFDTVTHPDFGAQIVAPKRLFEDIRRTPRGYAFERKDDRLSLSFVGYNSNEKTFAQLYESLAQPTAQRQVTYKTLKDRYFVSTGMFRGREYYTWMSVVPRGASGFTISWSSDWQNIGMRVAMVMANTFVPVSNSVAAAPELPLPTPNQETDRNEQAEDDVPKSGTGTGFKITSSDHLLTNYHVAGRCRDLKVVKPGDTPIDAELVAADSTNDLALLKTKRPLAGSVAKFYGGSAPKAGQEIAVYGFPLSDALASSGNIVVGNIAALAGLGNDSRHYQISAPVQPGNSGGPVLNYEGAVVAIVVSKLNAIQAAKITGDIPQNINFAIKGSVATNFLDSNGISFERQDSGMKMDVPAIADLAREFTYLIECRN
jgi:S1-C subfamily serine protease